MPEHPIRLDGLPDIPVTRHARSRGIRLKHSQTSGQFRISAAPHVSRAEIRAFVEAHKNWIQRRASRPVQRTPFEAGRSIPILDRAHVITPDPAVRRPYHHDGRLWLPANADVPARTLSYLKQLAYDHLSMLSRQHYDRLRPPIAYKRMAIRDQKSRWGSCSRSGTLSYNWRIIMAPWYVVDGLAAHEVAHFKHMDHSPAFWATCRWLCADTDQAEAWLKAHGTKLMRYGPPQT